MTNAADLFIGRTVHERRMPFTHRFSYRIASLMIDLDRLEEAAAQSRLFSVNRFNLYSFFERDHGARDGRSLKDWALEQFAEAGLAMEATRIRLLCAPRVLNYVFNPISIYFAENPEDGQLKGVIYQVHNTFGDAHAYVAPCSGETAERMSADKVLHVSPFFDVDGRYEFTLRQPGDQFRLTIFKQREHAPDFMATMALKREALTTQALGQLAVSQPLSTLKTISAIHFEALKLWAKGAKYHSRPEPPEAASLARPGHETPRRLGKN